MVTFSQVGNAAAEAAQPNTGGQESRGQTENEMLTQLVSPDVGSV